VAAIGRDLAHKLCRHMQFGTRIDIPKTAENSSFARSMARLRADIDTAIANGESPRAAALRIGTTERAIYRRRAQLRAAR
jgi:hypothetical protein